MREFSMKVIVTLRGHFRQLSPEGSSACPDILPEKAISPPESQEFESVSPFFHQTTFFHAVCSVSFNTKLQSDGSDSENDAGPAKPATAGNVPAPSQSRKRESDEAMEVPDDIAFKKPALPAARKLPPSSSKPTAPNGAGKREGNCPIQRVIFDLARPSAPVTRPKTTTSTRPVYRHSWNPDSDDEDEAEKEDDNEPSKVGTYSYETATYAVY